MNMNYPFKAILMLSAFCVSGALFAQTEQRTVTVQECVSLALQNNPDIRAQIEDENKSIADYRMVKGYNSLNVDLTFAPQTADKANQSTVTVPTNPDAKYYYYPYFNFQATYPLYNPAASAKESVSRKNVDIAKIQGKKGRDDLVGNVKSLYYGLIRAHRIVNLRDQIRKNYESRLASIRIYVARGDRPVLEQSSAEVALSQVVLELKAAKNQESDIMSDLKTAVGLPNDAPDIVVTELPELPDVTIGIDQMEGLINSYCTDVQIAAARKEQAQLNITAARMQHMPTITIVGGATYSNPNIDISRDGPSQYFNNGQKWGLVPYVGMAATVNLYAGGRVLAQTDSAIADYNKAVYNHRRQLMNARKNAQNFLRRLKELKEQEKVVKLNIANSKMNLTLTQRSFDSGIVNQMVVQNAEMGLLQAQMSLVDAQCEYFRILAALSNLIGLEESFLCGTN